MDIFILDYIGTFLNMALEVTANHECDAGSNVTWVLVPECPSAQAPLPWTMQEEKATTRLYQYWSAQNLGCTNVSMGEIGAANVATDVNRALVPLEA